MQKFLIAIHIVISIALIAAILLHSGRGTGLSNAFGGGGLPASVTGATMIEKNLDRLTVALALIFVTTSLALIKTYT